ncbi:hypothetical protein BCR35DRAFT_18680 [Leucosporidium creatinivorum]|uniref:F-box domain-containing protein n=1 Tax=Leucosporidium creatinivorum TaxID=106004 RepID=A0A1Y2D120_9BASI|nr:hypothetical protein BCR35DRAFT_18680 [Leucosporidium creatinivorum]
MATEQAQQPPAARITRPQQPTDAPAASLPTETVVQILNEGLDLWGRQKARMRFARVCVAWYGAVEVGRELIVKDTKVAERCAKSLIKGGSERRDRIRSLSIKIEENGAGRGQRIADLVSACRQTETLQLLGIGPRLGTWACHLGKPLTQALKSLRNIKSFEINSSSRLRVGGEELSSILSNWPHLNTLLLPTISTYSYSWLTSDTFQTPAISLYELQLSLDRDQFSAVLSRLLKSSESTLRRLDLGAPAMTAETRPNCA